MEVEIFLLKYFVACHKMVIYIHMYVIKCETFAKVIDLFFHNWGSGMFLFNAIFFHQLY